MAFELQTIQEKAAFIAQQIRVLLAMREGDRVRVRFERSGQVMEQVGKVRVLTDVSFFLELGTGSLLLIEDTLSLEILSAEGDVAREE